MRKKGKIFIVAMCVCMLMSGMTVFASTVKYTITVNKTATGQDNLSKKTYKDSNSAQYFCVTPTYFNTSNAAFFAFSQQKNGSACSSEIYVENGINEERTGYYSGSAPCGVYYYMQTRYGYSSTGTVKSEGTYTP